MDEGQCRRCGATCDHDAAFLRWASRSGDHLEGLYRPAGEVMRVALSPHAGGLPVKSGRGSALPLQRRWHAARRSGAFFVELAADQFADGVEGGFGFGTGRRHDDRGSRPCGEHHQPHDRGTADGLAAARHPDFGVEALDHLDEFCGSARVQAALVDDGKFAGQRVRRDTWPGLVLRRRGIVAHFPARTRLAMVTYLRPASWAMAMASGSERSSRTLASLTSMGRLIPASTSTFGRLMHEIARLEGVPPNMSVRMATPSPESTRLTASMMSLRHKSESSSAPIVTASICFCGPMTCSSAALNSSARRPWVTSTRPIIGNSSWVLWCTARTRHFDHPSPPRKRGVLRDSPGNFVAEGEPAPVIPWR